MSKDRELLEALIGGMIDIDLINTKEALNYRLKDGLGNSEMISEIIELIDKENETNCFYHKHYKEKKRIAHSCF